MGNHWARQKVLEGIGGDSSVLEAGKRVGCREHIKVKARAQVPFC